MTKTKFQAYLSVQASGVTNMFDVTKVIKYAKKFADIVLSREDCIDIMKNYGKYKVEFA